MEDILKRSNFFTDETKKVVLTSLRLETRSDKYYYWNFTMHSISSSNFFLRPWCTSTPFFSKRARFLFISMIHPWGYFRKKHFFHRWDQKSCFILSMHRNTFQHSLLLKFHSALNIFIKLRFAALLLFYSVLPWESKMFCSSQWFIQEGSFKKKQFFHRWDQKSSFNLSTLRNRFQHLLLLKIHHAINTFIKLRFAALVLFYSVLPWESKVFCSSQWFTQWGYFEKKQFFHRWDQKHCFNLSTLRNTFQYSLLLKFHHALKIFIKFLLLSWCSSTPFYTKRARYSLHLSDSSMEEFLKRSNFFTVETKIGFILSTLRNRFQHLLLLKFHQALIICIKFLIFRAWCTFTPFYSNRAR